MSEEKGSSFRVLYALSIAWQLGFVVIASILGFVILGIWADSYFGTGRIFMVVGIVTGVSISSYEMYHSSIILIRSGVMRKK